MKKILYIRSGPYQIDINGYNLQEVGLASAFRKLNVSCDVMYYHKKKNFNQQIKENNQEINILWRKGIRLLRSGVYPQILNKKYLDKYDAIIISEYSQIMAVLLCKFHKNVYIYNGPYYNLFKIKWIEGIYDRLFYKYLNKNVKKIFCKTKMAKEYLESKGFEKCETVGVGLDINKFYKETVMEEETRELISVMKGYRNMLYVGSISKRKNIELLIKTYSDLKKKKENSKLQLVIIGDGDWDYYQKCLRGLSEEEKKSIKCRKYIKNNQLQYIYKKAEIFMLPSKQEIFGMVLLEAMYFGVITIASPSAGAQTLIEDGKSGYIINQYEVREWVNKINYILSNPKKQIEISNNSKKRIKEKFMWENITKKMMESIEFE